MADRYARQEHLGISHSTTTENAATRAQSLNAGTHFKGDYTHFHHVLIKADKGNLANYLSQGTAHLVTGPVTKLDSTGRSVVGTAWDPALKRAVPILDPKTGRTVIPSGIDPLRP